MRISFILAVFILTMVSAQAGLLVEPIIGYSVSPTIKFSDDKEYEGGSGLSYGGRLGYQRGGFQVGADYLKSSINMSSGDFDNKLELTELGPFVGFEFPLLLRVYAGYIASAKGQTEVLNQNTTAEDGKGYKLGLGLTPIPFIDVNLEYRKGKFDEFKQAGTTNNANIDYSVYMLSLSMPLNLFDGD